MGEGRLSRTALSPAVGETFPQREPIPVLSSACINNIPTNRLIGLWECFVMVVFLCDSLGERYPKGWEGEEGTGGDVMT